MEKKIEAAYVAKDGDGGFEFGNVESKYGATPRYFTYDGKPWLPAIGEFHFSRCDCGRWDVELAKMRAEGLDGVSVYIFWNHHESRAGCFDFSGDRDIKRFLGLCRAHSLKVVLRIGPWCHGEVRRGGFPDYLAWVPGKRRSTPLYMRCVKRYWSKLIEQVGEFCDGETVIGVQLENEYTGKIDHIHDLRQLAEEVGFKTPYFTMTAWPTNTPSKRFVPMCGGYPEAPWTGHKRRLEPSGRFAVSAGRLEAEIGEDLIKTARAKADFSALPYAGCEVGTGNQVTSHRRPVISAEDGYGVAFAKLASGMNWMGYYMYHGGRNPAGKPLQESRRTLYPNDYPIIDYDFQAPLSKDGKVREHGDRLRLLHIFLHEWDNVFARTEAFFDKKGGLPYFSVRADESHGYAFVSNYERGAEASDATIDIDAEIGGKKVCIGGLKAPWKTMLFFPLCCEIGGVGFDFITAQPITKVKRDDGLHAYFLREEGVDVRIGQGGREKVCRDAQALFDTDDGKVILHFLTCAEAYKLHVINGRLLFTRGSVYEGRGRTFAELYEGDDVVEDGKVVADFGASRDRKKATEFIKLEEIPPTRLKYASYLFSHGKRGYYRLAVDDAIFDGGCDAEVTLAFEGLNLQIFCRGVLVDDYFNIDGKCVFRPGRLRGALRESGELIIRTCAKTASGAGNPYLETDIENGVTALGLSDVKRIGTIEVKI